MKLNIDFDKLANALKEIDDTIIGLEDKMRDTLTLSNNIIEGWEGKDAKAFIDKIRELNSRNSTLNKELRYLKNRQKQIKKAKKKYQKVQQDAYNIAARLPR